MLVPSLVHQDLFLRDHPGLFVYVVPFQVLVLNFVPSDHHHFAGFQKAHLSNVGLGLEQGQQRGQVASDNRLALCLGHHYAAGVAQSERADLCGISLQDGGDGLGALYHASHSPERLLEAETPIHTLFHQMGEDFSVGLRAKFVSGVDQPPF